MKKLALALMASAVAVIGLSPAAHAYPPGAGSVTASPGSGAPGYTVTVTISCQPGENVTATLNGVTSAPVVCPAGGEATINVTAPTTPGTFTGTTNGSVNGALGNFLVTVVEPTPPPPALPDTGSGGVSTMTLIAIGMFAIGAGLFGTSRVRRRQATHT